MRGELCIGVATVLSLTSTLLLIFVHVGQINTSNVPRKIAMAKINVSGYGDALHDALFNPIQALYTDDAYLPLGASLGLRQFYEFGLYQHCGYVDEKQGTCSNYTIDNQFRPFDALTADMLANYSILTRAVIVDIPFVDSDYLGPLSQSAYRTLLTGFIASVIAVVLGLWRRNFTFFAATVLSIAGSINLLVGASIWTVMINKSASVNRLIVGQEGNPSPVGIEVTAGNALYLTWAAFACLTISTVPYMISCCTLR